MAHDMFLLDCNTYEDYLDTFVTLTDIRFIRKIYYCHMLVKLGYKTSTELYTPSEFERRKLAIQQSLWPAKKSTIFFSDKMDITDPVLKELASREKPNIQKNISTIIFVKSRLKSGFEISGYIDYEQSLRRANMQIEGHTDWESIFKESKLLKPKPNHLSYFDWHSGTLLQNNSDNYIVEHDVDSGLTFRHRGDLRKVFVDISQEMYNKNCKRSMIFSPVYGHVIFYDHVIKRKL